MKDFNGGFIVASKEAYDLLVESGYIANAAFRDDSVSYYVDNNSFDRYLFEPKNKKQFYINNGAFSWTEEITGLTTITSLMSKQTNSIEDLNELPIVGEEDGKMDADSNDNILDLDTADDFSTCDIQQQTISITDDIGKEYIYNPNSNRLTSLLGVVEDDDGVQIVGYVIDAGQVQPIVWDAESGNAYINFFKVDKYNLTPIRPKEITVSKIVSYEYNNMGVVESREEVTITEDYFSLLSQGKE